MCTYRVRVVRRDFLVAIVRIHQRIEARARVDDDRSCLAESTLSNRDAVLDHTLVERRNFVIKIECNACGWEPGRRGRQAPAETATSIR